MSKVSQQKDNIRQSTTHGCLAGFIKHYTSFHDKIQEKHNERHFCQANLGSDFLGKAEMKSAQSKKLSGYQKHYYCLWLKGTTGDFPAIPNKEAEKTTQCARLTIRAAVLYTSLFWKSNYMKMRNYYKAHYKHTYRRQ